MLNFSLTLDQCPAALRAGLAEIIAERPARFGGGTGLTFTPAEMACGYAVTGDARGLTVAYARPIDAFRALGCLLGSDAAGPLGETPAFDMLGAMVDVSRNGVMTVPAAKSLLRRCALMGVNLVMLYSEDTYEVPGLPFFGYLRGRYTYAELKELDDYAAVLGIEMMPCIQTLGHLAEILQWPAFAAYRDTNDILLAGDEPTYALIEKMIAAASAPFRSKRIHIGMDEAGGLGTGRYKEIHGANDPFTVLNDHLARVREICAKQGLRPMIWSDLYFSLVPSGGYYDSDFRVPQEVIDRIPKGVDLVYWDYYHSKVADYENKIDQHRALGSEPLVAGGVWTWNRLWTALPYAFTVTNACMTACRNKGIREVFMTMWGDDGMECDVFSALPALQYFAEHGYAGTVDPARVAANFRGACDGAWDDFCTASQIDYFATLHDGTKGPDNVSKWLLWQDPLLAVTDPNLDDFDARGYYRALAEKLSAAAAKPGLVASRLRYPAAIAHALSLKVNLRRELAAAYQAGDKTRLRALAATELPAARAAIDALWRCHRDLWLETNKPFGWEVIELRYGGVRIRLESLAERLAGYLDGTISEIPELAVKLEKVYSQPLPDVSPDRRRVQTPTVIF